MYYIQFFRKDKILRWIFFWMAATSEHQANCLTLFDNSVASAINGSHRAGWLSCSRCLSSPPACLHPADKWRRLLLSWPLSWRRTDLASATGRGGVSGGTTRGARELRCGLMRVNKRLYARSHGCHGNVTSSTLPLNISGRNEWKADETLAMMPSRWRWWSERGESRVREREEDRWPGSCCRKNKLTWEIGMHP